MSLTHGEWSVVIQSLEFSLGRLSEYRYDDPEQRQLSMAPVDAVLAKCRAARRAAKAASA